MSITVTYSPAYTLVPTYECFNRCTYCNFRADPGTSPWLTVEAATRELRLLRDRGIVEILVLSGEVHPHSPRRSLWFQRIYDLCQLALSLGFLPHTNVGPLSRTELAQLATVNVSMGLMLEQLTPQLLQTVHRHAPSKRPEVRLQQLDWAGELRIPFTTGLLLGIGETMTDREVTLRAIADCHRQWGHIQEVILQPHSQGTRQLDNQGNFSGQELVEVVVMARRVLPDDIAIQIPPNLIEQPDILLACLTAGARDLGGIGPHDEVNPDYPHPHLAQLTSLLAAHGWQLQPRLPVYPQYDPWLSAHLQARIHRQRSAIAAVPQSPFTPPGEKWV